MWAGQFYDLLGAHGLLVKHRKRGPKTTNSNHFYRKFPNLIRDIELSNAGNLWVSDITYIRTEMGFVYLSLITDAYSKKIVGWSLWPDLTSEGALNALKMAISTEGIKQGLIHHSDRGIQYCCNDYANYLKGSEIAVSMTENGDSIFSIKSVRNSRKAGHSAFQASLASSRMVFSSAQLLSAVRKAPV